MDKKNLIDRGTYYEIIGYEPVVKRDDNGHIIHVINCPYIPKCFVDGDEQDRQV